MQKGVDEAHLALWEETVLKGDLIYPSEQVARFIFKNRFKSGLDFGCGAGRHLECFKRSGTGRIIGIDINYEPLKRASMRLGGGFSECENGLVKDGINLFCNRGGKKLNELLNGQKVEGIVVWGILCISGGNIQSLLGELRDALMPNGKILMDFRSPNNSQRDGAKEVGDNIFEVTMKGYEGYLYSFHTPKMIEDLCDKSGLKISAFDTLAFTQNGGKIKNEFYAVEARPA